MRFWALLQMCFNKRRMILNDTFDNSRFTLRFQTIDNIVQEIKNCNEDPYLMKIDVSRAFRNLRVNPKDCLKFGLKWGDSYFIDGTIAFGFTGARRFN